jgi:type IV secretory pathway TrbD component
MFFLFFEQNGDSRQTIHEITRNLVRDISCGFVDRRVLLAAALLCASSVVSVSLWWMFR